MSVALATKTFNVPSQHIDFYWLKALWHSVGELTLHFPRQLRCLMYFLKVFKLTDLILLGILAHTFGPKYFTECFPYVTVFLAK